MRLSEDFLAKKRRSCGEVSQNAPEHRRFRIRPLTEGEGAEAFGSGRMCDEKSGLRAGCPCIMAMIQVAKMKILGETRLRPA